MLITLCWEVLTAFMAFLTVRYSGRKAIWLQRLKNEVLALGVITLVLGVISDKLESICIPGDPDSENAGNCEPHYHQIFSYHLIHSTHWLLFTIAVMHIVVTCASFYMSLLRVRSMHAGEVEMC